MDVSANGMALPLEPCRVASPKDKGKVERDVQTIREEFKKIQALNPALSIFQSNANIRQWLKEQYGKREHGTTHEKPFEVFSEIEQPLLKNLPSEPFDLSQWKQATVHPDCYIQFNKKAYSVAYKYIGKTLWIRGTNNIVQMFYQEQLIKQHTAAVGFRRTDIKDFPENIQAALDKSMPLYLQNKAKQIGENFYLLIRNTLKPNSFLKLSNAQGLVSLSDKHSSEIVEQSAAYCLEHCACVNYKLFKNVVEKITMQQQNADEVIASDSQTESFIREAEYFTKTQQL